MTESQIEAAAIKLVAEKMGVDEHDISGDTRFTEDLKADSLDTVELIMDLETDIQCLIMTPFDAKEFRGKLGQMELGF